MKFISESGLPSLLMAQLQGVGLGTPKLTEPNPTTNTNMLKKQEPYKMVFTPLARKTLSFRAQEHIAVRLYSN
ncbi:hypothetical protein HpCK22_05570 [Helicobacter pylori]